MALLLSCGATPARAADIPTPKWDVSRLTPPADVKELKLLQDTVKSVVEQVTPSTVAVLLGMGAGSGVIVSDDGLVLTAAHVISPPVPGGDSTKTAIIVLADGSKVKAKVLGRNPRWDSGMLKITDDVPKDAKWPGAKDGKWPAVALGDSDAVKKGQWIVALGHPGGPKEARRAPVRVGQVVLSMPKQNVIRTDCTLVGGDSGGPLFDMSGKVIGIHSRIGLTLDENYHVSAKGFKDDWDDMLAGYVIKGTPRAYIGIVLNRQGENDLRVDEVRENTPASKAGVETGDLIARFDGQTISDSDSFDELIKASKPGKSVKLEVLRGSAKKEMTIVVGKLYEDSSPRRRNK